MQSLPIFLKLAGRPVILLGDGEAAEAKRRLLLKARAKPVGEDDDEARLAIVAIADDDEAFAAVKRLRSRGILVNATDRLDLCDFTLPAIVDREPVLIAIGTGGASAGIAKTLRLFLERMLPPTLGALATAMFEARGRIRTRWSNADDRRIAIDAALASGGPLDPLSDAGSADVERWIAEPMTIFRAMETIMLRSGDPDDLTLREARLLGRADRIVHDPDIPEAILARARADAVRIAGNAAAGQDLPGLTLVVKWGG